MFDKFKIHVAIKKISFIMSFILSNNFSKVLVIVYLKPLEKS